MNNELITRIKLEALITEREGMKADNDCRKQHENCSLNYGYDSFFCIQEAMRKLIDEYKKYRSSKKW